ncbi:hypothetical protein BTN49_0630 [Candidatus Enterovibrio escicola]|uniref:Uncharacterized protein n=1 Tax=Candidatus Enterovibrio escicola TaxID=1927127 RepID=A0A2A5T675_9GAMM|nr:hypothetical protein BTN49_0630 [Candidatus Enterovibrio escacola]
MGKLRIRNKIPTVLGVAGIWLITHDVISFFELAYWFFEIFLRVLRCGGV